MIEQIVSLPMPMIYLLVIGLVLRHMKWARWLAGTSVFLLILCAFPVTAYLLYLPLHHPRPSAAELEKFQPDCILLPTAGALKVSDQVWIPTVNSYWRLAKTVELQQAFHIPIIISGGALKGAPTSEAALLAQQNYLPLDPAILDESATNTVDSAIQFARIMKENNLSRPLVVTDSHHMLRMRASLAAQGISSLGYNTGLGGQPPLEWDQLIPTRNGYFGVNSVLREYVALTYYIYQGYFSLRDLTRSQPF
ncbi:YdcF family protein [Aestuariispira insulae]|uniref:Uncharacterized SAM-binding protein YcdF (DUF218 family) n=1 Tax=Aestuariispira insulae TaxID=1461337 RepID=A0A3D9HJG7_9PROT|nr:YdcF family protein [Aestuariispira insulae]RED49647.1 uncharacterized SAM-binding protein YcdF (DUF218 family) [Aestuariispira insulae]